jgi:hypothetical protein
MYTRQIAGFRPLSRMNVCNEVSMYSIFLTAVADPVLVEENSASMSKPSTRKNANERPETEKVPILVIKRIREAILDEVFKPGDYLGEVDLAEKFEVSRWPVREALLALEKEGTAIMSPYKGAQTFELNTCCGVCGRNRENAVRVTN